ncbi:hypothetical protein [Polynucleobacter necessarius]|uniref:hypothetical protein n=1 Tax=Polynucleobacter necessarius TaxID=576610 RepID=UPI0013B04D4C|nr:hypothetical protein [Polynucleobacter necessarius]
MTLFHDIFTPQVLEWMARFCFGYPFVMSWYWIVGSILYWFIRERHRSEYTSPPHLLETPLVSVLFPCFNEADQLHETMVVLMDFLATQIMKPLPSMMAQAITPEKY